MTFFFFFWSAKRKRACEIDDRDFKINHLKKKLIYKKKFKRKRRVTKDDEMSKIKFTLRQSGIKKKKLIRISDNICFFALHVSTIRIQFSLHDLRKSGEKFEENLNYAQNPAIR